MFGFFGRVGRGINDAISGSDGMVTKTEQVRIKDPKSGETKVVDAEVKRRREPDDIDTVTGAAATALGGGLLIGMMGGSDGAEAGETCGSGMDVGMGLSGCGE